MFETQISPRKQHLLSPLVLGNISSNITDARTANGEVVVASTRSIPVTPASGGMPSLRDQSSIEQKSLGGFNREPEDYKIVTGDVQKRRVSTLSTPETHVSVHMVHDLLPYRQQFGDAGLAIMSADQQAPPVSITTKRHHDSGSKDARFRFSGENLSTRTRTKDCTGDGVVDIFTVGPLAFTGIDTLPPSEMETRKKRDQQPLDPASGKAGAGRHKTAAFSRR